MVGENVVIHLDQPAPRKGKVSQPGSDYNEETGLRDSNPTPPCFAAVGPAREY